MDDLAEKPGAPPPGKKKNWRGTPQASRLVQSIHLINCTRISQDKMPLSKLQGVKLPASADFHGTLTAIEAQVIHNGSLIRQSTCATAR